MVGKLASEYGCQQCLWLCGPDQKLTEAGSMNIFVYWINEKGGNILKTDLALKYVFFIEHELVTPPLEDGLILAGITRDSVLAIVREYGDFKVSERYPTMEEMRVAAAEGRVSAPILNFIFNFGIFRCYKCSAVGRPAHCRPLRELCTEIKRMEESRKSKSPQ